MGAWSADSFGNEEALDWLNDLLDEDDPYFVHNTLEILADFPENESPEAWDCCCALAAAEFVAAAKGNPPPDFPEEAMDWIKQYNLTADSELVTAARKAVSRVQSNSGLKEVWDQSESADEWRQCVTDLMKRLG